LCIVWIGFDDYSDLRLSGADTAAPIWAGFMKRAVAMPRYKDVKPFTQPSGVVDVRLDKVTNRLATSTCPDDYTAAFIAGTEPRDTCDQVASDQRGFFSRLLGLGPKPLPPTAVSNVPGQPPPRNGTQGQAQQAQTNQPEDQSKKKKGFFGRLFGGLKDDNKSDAPPPQPSGGQQPRQP